MPTRKWAPNTTTANDQDHSAVAALAGGGFVVVWEETGLNGSPTPPGRTLGQRFDAAGNPVGAIDVNATNDELLPAVAGLADGGFYVTWTQLSGTANFILGNVYDSGGAFVRSQTVDFAFGKADTSKVTALGTGAAAVWEEPEVNSGDIQLRIFDKTGTGGAVLTANTATAGLQDEPAIAASPDQTHPAIVWRDAATGNTIQGRVFDAAGNEDEPQFRIDLPVSTLAVGNFEPGVAWLNDDQFVVTWRQANFFNFGGNEIEAHRSAAQNFLCSGKAIPTALLPVLAEG